MTIQILTEFLINTLSLGSLYALISLGLVFVFGIMQLVNFAYGEYLMVSAYAIYFLGTVSDLPWPLVFAGAIIAGAVIALLSELIAFRPLRGRSVEALLVTSFAVSVILQHSAQLLVSPRSRAVLMPPALNAPVDWFGASIPLRSYVLIGTTAVLLIGFSLLMKKTVLGIAMRAASEDFTTARLMGVPSNLVVMAAFAISGLLAGVAAIFWTARSGTVEPLMGAGPLLVGFIAVVIGGMHSLTGAVLGGFLYAAVANVLSLLLPSSLLSFRDAFMFAIVMCFLVLRPQGLLRGSYTEERVG